MSDKTRVTFTIKESGEGVPYLHMEFLDSIPGLPQEPPAFDLPAGTDMEKARQIAGFLNQNLVSFRPFPNQRRASFQTEVR